MNFYLDTANLDQIRQALSITNLDGVTTNPSLMAKEGIKGEENILKHYQDICNVMSESNSNTIHHVSAEVISLDYDGMIKEGEKLSQISQSIVIKLPATIEGLKAIKYFSRKGVRTNCTLIFSPGQAILAAKAGATYISPFVGRVDDITWDGIGLIEQISTIFKTHNISTKILAASIRTPLHIVQCAEAGADIVTCPLSAIIGLMKHPLTDLGIEQFLKDYKKSQE